MRNKKSRTRNHFYDYLKFLGILVFIFLIVSRKPNRGLNFLIHEAILSTSLADCDIMRSRTSWDVAEEAKENWFPERFAGRSSSASPEMSSGIELVVQEEEPLAGLEPMHEKEGRGGGGGEGGGTASAFETSKAEALHDLERNSIGNLGLSGSWVPPRRVGPPRREFLGRSVSSIIVL